MIWWTLCRVLGIWRRIKSGSARGFQVLVVNLIGRIQVRYSEYKVVGKSGEEHNIGVVQVDEHVSFVVDRKLVFMVSKLPDYYEAVRMVRSDRSAAVVCSDYGAALKFVNGEIVNDTALWRRF